MSLAPRLSTTAIRLLAVTALSFSMLSACGKAEESAKEAAAEAASESAIEAMTGAEVDIENGGETITGVDANGQPFSISQGESATLPDGFPEDVLVPEGMRFDSVIAIDGTMMVAGEAPGEMAAVSATIAAAMKDAGWSTDVIMEGEAVTSQIWEQGERGVSYQLEAKPDGGVGVAISYMGAMNPSAEAVPEG